MKTYTKEQIILSDGEVSIWSKNRQTMLMSTDTFYNRIGVKIIDRNRFVRGVGVKMIAADWMGSETINNQMQRGGFIAGYNANKNEFTFDELRQAWEANEPFEDYMKRIRPLELPASIEVDEMFNIINVKWE